MTVRCESAKIAEAPALHFINIFYSFYYNMQPQETVGKSTRWQIDTDQLQTHTYVDRNITLCTTLCTQKLSTCSPSC